MQMYFSINMNPGADKPSGTGAAAGGGYHYAPESPAAFHYRGPPSAGRPNPVPDARRPPARRKTYPAVPGRKRTESAPGPTPRSSAPATPFPAHRPAPPDPAAPGGSGV